MVSKYLFMRGRMKINNPFLGEWKTPFEMPPFHEIKVQHFKPAFDVALEKNKQEIEAIAENKEAPSFDNTLKALELAGETLSKVTGVFYNLSGAHTNSDLQEIEREMAPKMAEHSSKIMLNEDLFKRVDKLYEMWGELDLSGENLRLLERYHTRFIRAGARLQGEARKRMGEITKRLATLGTSFSQNVLADESAYELLLSKGDDLSGLPDFLIQAAQSAAKERGYDDKYIITLSRSLIEPFLQFSERRDLREKAFKAWISRGDNDCETNNHAIIKEILVLREERAKLLGFETFAHFKLDDQMAKKPQAVQDLLMKVWKPARKKATEEAEKLLSFAKEEGLNSAIKPWDWRFYAEKVRKAKYDLNASEIKPYLQLDEIIKAAFYVAGRLFGLNFTELEAMPTYHDDVRIFEVTDSEGQHVALFMGDYFARPSKRSGAWMSGFRTQQKLKGDIRPIIVNVMNFAKAPEGMPCLLTFDDARTLFHEFGHALHGMLSNVTYPSLSGTAVARDFVELPSQLFEHWLMEEDVLSKYACHYKTGEKMPKALMTRIKMAETFNQGFQTVEYVSCALIDLALHTMTTEQIDDLNALERNLLDEISMPDEIVMRHRIPHFSHIFSGDGYSSGYYSYMWSEVMDADAFQAFKETQDIFDAETAKRLIKFIYSSGGSRDPEDLYTAFRGKMPEIHALLEGRDLKDVA